MLYILKTKSGNNRPILLGTLQLFPLACRPAVCRSECCSSSLFEYTVSDGKNVPLNFKGGINEALSLIDFASSTVFVLSLRFCLLLYDSFSHLEFGSRSHIVNILDIVFWEMKTFSAALQHFSALYNISLSPAHSPQINVFLLSHSCQWQDEGKVASWL